MTDDHKSETAEITFLSDQPLSADREQEMRFGHPSIADTLEDIILSCPTPFTVGLFGKWGVGKTSIINVLKERLLSKDVATVIFDIWKHEVDSLRRTFLKEATNQLKKQDRGLEDTFTLDYAVDSPVTRVFQGGFKLSKKIKPIMISMLLGVIIVAVIIGLKWNQALGTYLSIVLGGGAVSTILVYLLQQGLTTETTTITQDRFQDPHEFEEQFKIIRDETQASKFLIIIDNLDRASHEKAVELLSTIKTFLEQKKCVFLIACDAKAIEKHLENVYSAYLKDPESKIAFDTEEFLRKFFNAYLRIPKFIDTEIQTYTDELLEQTNIKALANSEVSYVIASAFRENPRQIKQFINTLAAHFLLAQKRETSEPPLILPGTITGHVDFLAKYLIVKNYRPADFQEVLEGKVTHEEKIDTFIRATKVVQVDNMRPFIYFKLSQEEISIPGIREIESDILYRDIESLKAGIPSILKDEQQFKDFHRHVFSLINQYRGRGLTLYNIVDSLLLIAADFSVEFSPALYSLVADLLTQESELSPYLHQFDPHFIFDKVLQKCHRKDRGLIIEAYIEYLNTVKMDASNQEYIKALTTELLKNRTLLTDKKRIVALLSNQFTSLHILSIFKDQPEYQKEFLTTDSIVKFVSEIPLSDVEEADILTEKIDLLVNFKDIIGPKSFLTILDKLTALINADQSKPYRNEKENLLNCVNNILSNLGQKPSRLTAETIQAFSDAITQGMNSTANWLHKSIFVLPCLWIIHNFEDPIKTNVTNLVNQFFTNADITGITYVFDKLDRSQVESLIQQYEPIFTTRSKQSPELFVFLYRFAPPGIRTKWLIDLINTQTNQAIQILGQEELVIDELNDTVKAILQRAAQLPPQQKEPLYSLCNKFKCAEDPDSINTFVEHIKSLLTQPDTHAQNAGLMALHGAVYISPAQKRDIATVVTNWLRTLPIENAGQTSAVKSVLVNWDHLLKQLKDDFFYFIFNTLIIHTSSIANIRLGLDVLTALKSKPNYEDYSTYFDDIRNRLESEPNTEIKQELINILTVLKPARTNEKNQEFWSIFDKSK